MKKTLLLLTIISCFSSKSQETTTLFEDSFDSYNDFAISNIGEWTLIDADLLITDSFALDIYTFPNARLEKSFQVFNSTTTTPPLPLPTPTMDFSAKSGRKSLVCFVAIDPDNPQNTPANNDWLISPPIILGTNNEVSFWAKSCHVNFGLEKFKIGVSSSGTAITDFNVISTGDFIVTSPAVTWIQYTFALPAVYDYQSVYFSVNCVSENQFGFAVDDFKVVGTPAMQATENFFAQNFLLYPNPATNFIHLQAKTNAVCNQIKIIDTNGRTVYEENDTNKPSILINTNTLAKGIYFIKVASDLGIGTAKLILN